MLTMRCANAGSPGAGYSASNNAFGKLAPKSWIVGGRSFAITRTPSVTQCAETITMALGFGNRPAISAQAREEGVSSIAFMGEPWPMKRAGALVMRRFLPNISRHVSGRINVAARERHVGD